MNFDCTIVIPTSPIQAHPSAEMIKSVVGRIRGCSYPELHNLPVTILVDGCRSEQKKLAGNYETYKKNLQALSRLHWIENPPRIVEFQDWQHQSGMLSELIPRLKTKYLLFLEHDNYLKGEIPFDKIFQAMEFERVSYIRFSIFDQIPEDHERKYAEKSTIIADVPLRMTFVYSARPHIAKVSFYEDILNNRIRQGAKTFIEDPLLSQNLPGMYQYHPEGSLLRSYTYNGRGSEPKYEMYF